MCFLSSKISFCAHSIPRKLPHTCLQPSSHSPGSSKDPQSCLICLLCLFCWNDVSTISFSTSLSKALVMIGKPDSLVVTKSYIVTLTFLSLNSSVVIIILTLIIRKTFALFCCLIDPSEMIEWK